MKLPNHKCGLFLTHNEHRDYYMPAADWIEENDERLDWQSPEHKQRAIETDEVWTLQWYPHTPVGFIAVAAPTLEELLSFANDEPSTTTEISEPHSETVKTAPNAVSHSQTTPSEGQSEEKG